MIKLREFWKHKMAIKKGKGKGMVIALAREVGAEGNGRGQYVVVNLKSGKHGAPQGIDKLCAFIDRGAYAHATPDAKRTLYDSLDRSRLARKVSKMSEINLGEYAIA